MFAKKRFHTCNKENRLTPSCRHRGSKGVSQVVARDGILFNIGVYRYRQYSIEQTKPPKMSNVPI